MRIIVPNTALRIMPISESLRPSGFGRVEVEVGVDVARKFGVEVVTFIINDTDPPVLEIVEVALVGDGLVVLM